MANALAGNIDEARKLVVRLRQILPALRLTNLKEYFRTTRRPEDIERAAKSMHLAGLPE
jgi:adenylate cyclase